MRDYVRAPAADLGGVLPVPPAGAGQKIHLKMEGEETAADKAN
jgi:hypothetical protein